MRYSFYIEVPKVASCKSCAYGNHSTHTTIIHLLADVRRATCRLSGLTRLEFRGPSADDEFPACEDLCLLKELKIWDAMVEPSWVETLLQRTPRLTSLYLNMPDDTPEDVEWDLLPNLR